MGSKEPGPGAASSSPWPPRPLGNCLTPRPVEGWVAPKRRSTVSEIPTALPRRLLEALQPHLGTDRVTGLVAAVAIGHDEWVGVLGDRSATGPSPVGRDTIFRIASVTKSLTAAAALAVVEDGTVHLDDPIGRYLPELAEPRVLVHEDGPLEVTVPAERPITIRDLLAFTMGTGIHLRRDVVSPVVRRFADLELGQGAPTPQIVPPPDEWVRRLATLPLIRQPGATWMYSTGSDVLGVLLARATGTPFDRLLATRLLDPLGMGDTGFSVRPNAMGRFTDCYRSGDRLGTVTVYDPASGGGWSRPPAFPSGAGGLVSTVDDLLRFTRMLRRGGMAGSRRILPSAAVQAMTTHQVTPGQKEGAGLTPGFFASNGWGFGVAVRTRADPAGGPVGEYGWNGGLGTTWWTDPERDLTALLLTTRAWDSPTPPRVSADFRHAVYAAS